MFQALEQVNHMTMTTTEINKKEREEMNEERRRGGK